MPTQSQISTRLTADNSEFRSVMNQTVDVTDKGAKAILKKLDIRAGVTAIAAAIGFNLQNIAEGIARLALGFSKESEKQLEDLVAATDKAADAQERALEKLRAKRERDAQEDSDRARREYEILRDARLKAVEQMVEDEKRIKQQAYDAQQDADERHRKYVEENLELLSLEAKAKRGLSVEESERLKVLRDQVAELDRQEQITSLLTLSDRSPQEEGLLQTLLRQSAAYKEQLTTVEQIVEKEKERLVTAEQLARAKWAGTVDVRGRADDQLSDAELEKKIKTLGADIFRREQALRGGGWIGPGQPFDPILSAIQNPAFAQAIAERDLRERVRRQAEFFGRDRAFRMFDGDEQRFEQILRGSVTQQERFLSVAEKLERQIQAIPEALKSLR
jgi:hypothetical protein